MKKILLLLLLLFKMGYSATETVYGGYDDRMHYYQLLKNPNLANDTAYYKELAQGVCMVTLKKSIGSNVGGKKKLYLGNISKKILAIFDIQTQYKKVCDSTHFRNEYPVKENNGTGSLIDDNKVLTAFHVYTGLIQEGPIVCIFNYYKTDANSFPILFEDAAKTKPYVLIDSNDIYDVTNTTGSPPIIGNDDTHDWAVLTLNKKVKDTQKRLCFYSGTTSTLLSKIGVSGNELFSWGFPLGLPMIFTDDGHLKNKDYYRVDLDLYGGNSGGPIFVKKTTDNQYDFTNKIVGVVSLGNYDYRATYDFVGTTRCSCWIDNKIDPKDTVNQSYDQISFIDNVKFLSAVSDTNCNKKYTPPTPKPQVTPQNEKVLGQMIKASFVAPYNSTYYAVLNYTANNLPQHKTSNIAGFKDKPVNIDIFYLAAGTKYYYDVFYGTGESTTIPRKYGKATVGYVGYANEVNTVPAMLKVGSPKSSGFPYSSLQAAIDACPDSTTLHVARGIYNENIVINKPITIYAEQDSNESTLLIPTTNATPAIKIISANVILKNFHIRNTLAGGTAIQMENSSTCTIAENIIDGFTTAINLKNCKTNNINNNFISGAGTEYGFIIDSCTGNTFQNNIVDYGIDIFKFTKCTASDNTLSGNVLITSRVYPTDVVFQNTIVSTIYPTINATNSITVRNDEFQPGGNIYFKAGNKINISDSVTIQKSSSVNFKIIPNLE